MDNRIEGVVLSVMDVDEFPKHGSKRSTKKGVSTAKKTHKKK
jgi:sensor domain CHASE-containing protein